MFVRFIRFTRARCVLIGSLDVWGFEELRNLIWHCWRGGVEGCMLIWVDCDLRCWKLSMRQWVGRDSILHFVDIFPYEIDPNYTWTCHMQLDSFLAKATSHKIST
jgi:hypothetical protein